MEGGLVHAAQMLGAARIARSHPGYLLVDTKGAPQLVGVKDLVDLRTRLVEQMERARASVQGDLDAVVDAWENQQRVDDDQPIVAAISKTLGNVGTMEHELREASAFAQGALGRFRLAVGRGDLVRAAEELEAAEMSTVRARQAWSAVTEGIIGGADDAVVTLQYTRNAAAVTVGLLAVVASGGALAGAATATGTGEGLTTAALANGIATAAPVVGTAADVSARLHLGMPVDWGATTREALTGLVMARLGGALSQTLFRQLAGSPALRPIGRAALARVLASVLTHEAATALDATAAYVHDALRGRPVTLEAYGQELLGRLADPKGIFVAAVFGAVTARFEATAGSRMGPMNQVATGGARNERSLTPEEASLATQYAVKLGMPEEAIKVSDSMNTGYKSVFGQDILYIGTDVLPAANGRTPNSRVSLKGAVAHELVGHRRAELAGRTQVDPVLEEAQASIRAARFAPELTLGERFTLLRDAIARLHKAGLSVDDVRDQLWIQEP